MSDLENKEAAMPLPLRIQFMETLITGIAKFILMYYSLFEY